MRAFWHGTISFGLVNIPVGAVPVVRTADFKFHFLHNEDLGRIHNERVCEECGKRVSYDQLVRGYEYEDEQYLPLTQEDFAAVHENSAKNIDIQEFVERTDLNLVYFDKPYYLVPDKKGVKAYNLLREALRRTGKAGLGKVAFRSREHLAAVIAYNSALILELLHFDSQLKKAEDVGLPSSKETVGPKELEMAEKLIQDMTVPLELDKYQDNYQKDVGKIIEAKIKGKRLKGKPREKPAVDNVIDIMSKLKASLRQRKSSSKKSKYA